LSKKACSLTRTKRSNNLEQKDRLDTGLKFCSWVASSPAFLTSGRTTALLKPCERRRQCTREQVPWEDGQRVIKDSASAGHPQHETSKAVAAAGCSAGHPWSGSQMLRVIQARCVWPNVISRYSTSRNLILDHQKKFRDSFRTVWQY